MSEKVPVASTASSELGDLLLATSAALRRRIVAAWEPWGLAPHEGRALLHIARQPQLRASDLATQLRITARSVTSVVDALVERDLVSREPHPEDRRAQLLVPTPQGQILAGHLQNARRDTLAAFLGGLEPDRRQALGAALEDLLQAASAPLTPDATAAP